MRGFTCCFLSLLLGSVSISFFWSTVPALVFNLGIFTLVSGVTLETVEGWELVEVSLLIFWKLARNGADEVVDGLKVEVSFGRAVIAGLMKGFV